MDPRIAKYRDRDRLGLRSSRNRASRNVINNVNVKREMIFFNGKGYESSADRDEKI